MTPVADLRAVIAGELLNRVGELLVATAPHAIAEQDARVRETERDAITEHEDGALDARISTALARAKEILLGDLT